jgi:pyruvate/2-oxoglutarate dehydrogenase complex dihydrolipoamide dehydrogenase (E3) component
MLGWTKRQRRHREEGIMVTRYDAIVIGTGQSGPPLAARLADEGMKIAVIERKKFGGTCVNVGCVPTKTLVASARAAYIARRAADFGVKISSPIAMDMAKVKARKDEIVDRGTKGIAKWMRSTDNVTVYEGHARFVSPKTVQVNGDMLQAKQIFINVGGRALVPDMPGIKEVRYLTNSTMLDVDFLPEHLIVIGGSYIGLEFAQIYRRFGSRVTVVEKADRLIAREDDDISDAVKSVLEGEGIEVRLKAECIKVAKRGSQIAVGLECADPAKEVTGSHLLLAIGRVPNTGDLGLDKAGVKTDPRGYITVDEELKTNVPGIWAIGDCNGRGAFTHTSYNDYEIVAANLLDGRKRKVKDRIPTYALFIDPPLGRAGLTEREARASGKKLLTATLPMTRIGRARERSETLGFMKLVVEARSKRILGAAVLGIEGDEVVQAILDLMYAKAPYTLIEKSMYIHPTVMEYLPTLVGNLEPLE